MKSYDKKNFLALLAKSRNLLVYDDGYILKEHKETLELFQSYRYNNINETTISNVSNMLITMPVDIVLIYGENLQDVFTLCQKIETYDKNIVITVIMKNSEEKLFQEILHLSETALILPFEEDVLYKKLSIALSAKLIIYEMSHTLYTHKKFLDETGIEHYLDEYEDEMKIVSEVLLEYVQRLKAGELSAELFFDMANEIENIGVVFTYHHYTAHLSMIFDEMVAFLRTYEFDDIDVTVLEGFDYLIEILQDIRTYIDDFFVKRIFSDVYVFEHSLHDSIAFMIRRLTKSKDISNEVEFF